MAPKAPRRIFNAFFGGHCCRQGCWMKINLVAFSHVESLELKAISLAAHKHPVDATTFILQRPLGQQA
jgi:hypothetical protein